MPKKLKKSKTGMHQKQVVNVNITNPKRRAKRVNKPKTNPRKLYPAEVQSHNSGVVLPYTHQFYLPPNDKSTPRYEELINAHKDGNLLQITQSNDLLKQLDQSHKLINQLSQHSMKEKSPKKIYDQLMQEHINRQNTKIISHIDDNGEMWNEEVNKNQPPSPTRKKINKILKEAIGQSPVIPAKRGRPKKVVLAQTPVQPLGEAIAPALIPKARGRPTLTEEQKVRSKADRLAKQNSGAGAGVSEYKNDEEQYINAKKLIAPHIKNYSNKLKESNDRLKSGLGFEDFDTEPSSAIGAPVQAEAKGKTKPSPVAKRTRGKAKKSKK